MYIGFAILIVLVVGTTATQPSNDGQINELKTKLMEIKKTVQSMKPTITMLGAYVDSVVLNQDSSSISVDDARQKVRDMNISDKCKQEAYDQLNEIQNSQLPSNCSAMAIFEDAGDVTYNSADFIATSMMYYDDVSRGLSSCQPWYEFWHSIPCFIRYIIDNIKHMKAISQRSFNVFKDDKAKVLNIVDQVKCTVSQIFSKPKSTSEVLNAAYLCAKNSH